MGYFRAGIKLLISSKSDKVDKLLHTDSWSSASAISFKSFFVFSHSCGSISVIVGNSVSGRKSLSGAKNLASSGKLH